MEVFFFIQSCISGGGFCCSFKVVFLVGRLFHYFASYVKLYIIVGEFHIDDSVHIQLNQTVLSVQIGTRMNNVYGLSKLPNKFLALRCIVVA